MIIIRKQTRDNNAAVEKFSNNIKRHVMPILNTMTLNIDDSLSLLVLLKKKATKPIADILAISDGCMVIDPTPSQRCAPLTSVPNSIVIINKKQATGNSSTKIENKRVGKRCKNITPPKPISKKAA